MGQAVAETIEERVMATITAIIDTYLRNHKVSISPEQKSNLARYLYHDVWQEDFTAKDFMRRIEIYVKEMRDLPRNPKRDLFTELLTSFKG